MSANQQMEVVNIPINEIDADDDFNCRGTISPIDVAALAKDIEAEGLINPGTVILHPDPAKGFKYKLIAGFRRFMAMRMLKRDVYPCSIRDSMSEDQAMIFNLNENIQRSELNIVQEAVALAKIKAINPGLSREQCAEKLGTSCGWVQIREMLLKLPVEVQKEVVAKMITHNQVRELYTVSLKEGTARVYEVAKQLKDARMAGRKARIKKKINRDLKHAQSRAEVFDMLDIMCNCIPFKNPDGSPLLWGKCMSWAAGEISDNELFEACKKFCDFYDLPWHVDEMENEHEVVEIK